MEALGIDRDLIARELLQLPGTLALTPMRDGLHITLLTDSNPRSYHYKFEVDVGENGLHGDVYESGDSAYVSVGRIEVDATDGLYVFLEDYSSDGYLSFSTPMKDMARPTGGLRLSTASAPPSLTTSKATATAPTCFWITA